MTPNSKEQIYAERLKRYTTAMHNGPACQEVTQDYQIAVEATRQCCLDHDWDAVVPNMVHLWAGIPQAAGLRC